MKVCKIPSVLERYSVSINDESIGGKLFHVPSGEVVIMSIIPNSSLDKSRVHKGDCLLSIGDQVIEFMKYSDVLKRLKETPRPMILTFGRPENELEDNLKWQQTKVHKTIRADEQKRLLTLQEEQKNKRVSAIKTSLTGVKEKQTLYTSKDFMAPTGRFRLLGFAVFLGILMLLLVFTEQISFLKTPSIDIATPVNDGAFPTSDNPRRVGNQKPPVQLRPQENTVDKIPHDSHLKEHKKRI